MERQTNQLDGILQKSPFIPVIAIENKENAVAIAESFLKAGVSNIEIVLRTSAALSSIKEISAQFSNLIIGAGTVLTKQQAHDSIEAGAKYIVSPGFSEDVHQVCLKNHVPYLPGAITPTEIQAATEKGFTFLKFFPSETMGGVKTLKSYAAVFEDIQFCATGGINKENISSYLLLPNVVSVGTSSLLTHNIQAAKDWARISDLTLALKAQINT